MVMTRPLHQPVAVPTILRNASSDPDERWRQQVRVKPDRWLRRLGQDSVPAELHSRSWLSRTDLLKLAERVRAGTMDPSQLFVAVMMWGYGTRGYGPARTAKMLATTDADRRIASAFQAANDPRDGARSGYAALADPAVARLAWLGPAFGTKFLYFAGHDRVHYGPQPLILDGLVGHWIERHASVRVLPWTWMRSAYGRYLDLIHGWAAELGWEPDQVEHRIFTLARSGQE
jgi:hypothetical protein